MNLTINLGFKYGPSNTTYHTCLFLIINTESERMGSANTKKFSSEYLAAWQQSYQQEYRYFGYQSK